MPSSWFVYIVNCRNNSYYTGITNNVEKRIFTHNAGKGGSYTRAFGPVKLLWKEVQPDKSSALKREAQIKKMTRLEKEKLISF